MHCRGLDFWATAPINHWLLLEVGDASQVSPGCAGSQKPKAGFWRRSQVLIVSLHSQQLPGGCTQSVRRCGQRAPGSTEEGQRSTRHLRQSQHGCLTQEPVLSSLGMKTRPAWHRGSPDTAEILSGFINCQGLSPLLPRLAWELQKGAEKKRCYSKTGQNGSFNSPWPYRKTLLSSPFCRYKNGHTEKLNHLPKATQQVGELRFQSKSVQPKNSCTAFYYTDYIYNFPPPPQIHK